MKTIVCVIVFGLLCVCSDNKVAGVIDETDTGIVGKVHFSNGRGAANVTVKVFLDTSVIPVDGTTTDEKGAFGFARLSPGSYSIWAQSNDSLGAFADSIQVFHAKKDTTDLTLGKCGSIVGQVTLQPQHEPQSVTVQALGTQKYSNVDAGGMFRLSGLAPGEYTLRLLSTEDGYTPTFVTVNVSSGVTDTLDNAIVLIYTGIPVVTNIAATYDTLKGVVRLTWNATGYKNLRDYLIYRDPANTVQPSSSPISTTKNNFYSDTLSVEGDYTYRIAVRCNDLKVGPTYYDATVTMYSAQQIYSIFNADSLHAPLNVPCTLRVNISPWFGSSPKLTWNVGPKASVLDSSAQTPVIVLHDTLTPDYPCFLTVQGVAGKAISDTLHLQSWLAWEKIAEPLISVGMDFKSAVFNGAMFAFVGESAEGISENDKKWHEWTSSDGVSWEKVSDSLPFADWTSRPVVFKGTMLAADNKGRIWKTTNGKTWNILSVADSCDANACFSYLLCDTNTLWYNNVYRYYSSSNGVDWAFQDSAPSDGFYPFYLGWLEPLSINGAFWMEAYNMIFGWTMLTGSSPISLHKKTNDFMGFSGNSPLSSHFVAIQFLDCILLVGFLDNEIRYSRDLGDTWNLCGDSYLEQNSQSGNGAEISDTRPHSCWVFNTHLFSISNKGVWKTK